MKKFFVTILMMFSISVWAGNDSASVQAAGFAKLSESEKAEVIKMVADKALSKDSGSGLASTVESVDKVERWVKIGSNIGQGLAGAAKEMGVAVNDFANTPVGRMTTYLIVWQIVGGTLMHFIGGLLVWIIGFAAIRMIISHAYPDEVIYSAEKKTFFGNAAIESKSRPEMSGEMTGVVVTASAVVIGAGVITMFAG
jgi:hypothetical protein